MLAKRLLSQILHNEALTRGLADPEARVLIEWLVDRAEEWADALPAEDAIGLEVKQLCRRGQAIGRFVWLWCQPRERGGAAQLAAVERFNWPLPEPTTDACELMQQVLAFETTVQRARLAALPALAA